MKQSKLISMIGALVVMISAVVCITACPGANNLKNNPEDSFEIKPTGEADAKLKDSLWSNEDRDVAIFFFRKGNLASIIGGIQALYTVKDAKISFDTSSWIAIYKNMTLDTYIQVEKAFMKENIAELEEMIKQETNAEKKKKLEQDLVRDKYRLQELENPSAEAKKSLQRLVQGMNKLSEAMEGGPTKFEGEFNADKTELTIEKFPFYDGKTITVKKVVLKKQ